MSRPTLVVCCGLPGVGKSTVSGYVADGLGATRHRSDEVRKRLFPDPSYTAEETAATYDELLDRARRDLDAGTNVVLDATFSARSHRDRAAEVARETGADARFVHVTCTPATVEERIEGRTDSVSDAGYDEYLDLRDAFDPIERDHATIDNSGTIEETRRQIDRSVL